MADPSRESGAHSETARRAFLSDLTTFLIARVLVALATLISIPIFTRLVPPGDYGQYVMVLAAVTIGSTVAVGWICSSVLRFYPMAARAGTLGGFYRETFRGTAFSTAIGLAVALAAVAGVWRAGWSDGARMRALLVAGIALFVVYTWSQVLLSLLRAKRAVRLYSAANVVQIAGGLFLAVVALTRLRAGVSGLVWGPVVVNAVLLAAVWKAAVGEREAPRTEGAGGTGDLLRDFASYGFPAAAIGIFSWVSSASDRYLIGALRSSAEVGVYSASYGVAEQGMFALVSLYSVTAVPIAFHLWETSGTEATRAFMGTLARYFLLVGLPLVVIMGVLAQPIMQLLAAPGYLPGYRVIPLVSFGAFLTGLGSIYSEGLTFHRRTDLLLVCYVVPGLLNVALNLASVPRFGYMAAAVNTLVSYAALFAITAVVSRRFFTWRFPIASLARATAAGAVMGVFARVVAQTALPLGIRLALAVTTGSVAYLGALVAMGEVRAEEWRQLRDIASRVVVRLNGAR